VVVALESNTAGDLHVMADALSTPIKLVKNIADNVKKTVLLNLISFLLIDFLTSIELFSRR
jgi:hypothetical protein